MKKNKSVARVIKVAETFSGDTQKQIRELKKCVREGRKTGDIFMMGIAYYFLAEASSDTDDLHGMLTNALKAVTLLKDTGEYEFTALAYTVLGHAYTNQGNNQMSLVCDEAAYELVKRHRIKGKTRIRALNSLSVSYHLMEETSKSVKCLNECIELLKRDYAEDYTDLFMYSLNLASCNKDIGELELARDILASLSGMVEKVDFLPLVCDYYLRSAIISFMLEDVAAGNGFMDAAFGIFPKNVYPLPLYDDLCEVSRIISKNGDKVRAGKIFDIMKVYAENNGGTLEQLFATLMMASYYKDFGEYRLAAEYYAKYEELNEKQTRELKEMQMKLHYTTRNTEIEIKRLKRKMRKNEELASIEPLTGLLNRSALLRVSSEFIADAAKKKRRIGAIFIDIDCFKEYNDTYGHSRGDEIIREVARACKKQETKNIRFARYGGDEFFGMTMGLSDEEVCDVASRICRTIRNADIPHINNVGGDRLTLSVGVANVPITDKTDTILEIANYADKAVYYAKNAGKNAIYELVHGGLGEKETGAAFVKIDF